MLIFSKTAQSGRTIKTVAEKQTFSRKHICSITWSLHYRANKRFSVTWKEGNLVADYHLFCFLLLNLVGLFTFVFFTMKLKSTLKINVKPKVENRNNIWKRPISSVAQFWKWFVLIEASFYNRKSLMPCGKRGVLVTHSRFVPEASS